MFDNLSDAVSGVLVFWFLAPDPTIVHPSCMPCRPTPHSCARPHQAQHIARKRRQGVHRLGIGVLVGFIETVRLTTSRSRQFVLQRIASSRHSAKRSG